MGTVREVFNKTNISGFLFGLVGEIAVFVGGVINFSGLERSNAKMGLLLYISTK